MAAISVQEDGGGDYTTLEAAVENGSTVDGDVITITETWNATTGEENTQIAVTDALIIQATGDSKHSGHPWTTGQTHWRHRNSSSGHSFTITDTGSVTFIGLDIQNESTGTSDEVFRNNVSNTFVAQDCVLGFASRTDQQDIFYSEAVITATFESCHFYNAQRAVVDAQSHDNGSVVNINSCVAYDVGNGAGGPGTRAGLVGINGSNTIEVNVFNTICHVNGGVPIKIDSTTGKTINCHTLITNAGNILNLGTLNTNTNPVLTATINDTDSSGNYILLDTTTSPFDLRLFDNATNNAAQDNHANGTGTGTGLTVPSTDIVGTSRPQNTDFDIGAFEIEAATGDFILVADSGSYTYTGTDAALTADRILTADSGTYTYTGTVVDLLKGVQLTSDSGAYSYVGTDANLLLGSVLEADSGAYTYSGTDATLTFTPVGNFILTADTGLYTYTGTNAGLLKGSLLAADSGPYTYIGTDATLTFGAVGDFTLTADSGAYVYSGANVELTADFILSADTGGYVYTGTAVDLTSGFLLQADSGAYVYSGTNVDFVQQRVLAALTGVYVYNGTDANIFFTPVAPDVPVAKGVNSSGAFGIGISAGGAFGGGVSASATFGSGIGSKGNL